MIKSLDSSLPIKEPIVFAAIMSVLFMAGIFTNTSSAACISYSSSSRTVTVSCTSATHLNAVYIAINNSNILKKESTGVWLLAANLVIAKGGNLIIDSSDGTWLKIRSDGTAAYGLKNSGTLSVDSVKITSWNTGTNNYALQGSSGQTLRGYILSQSGATGKTNILNSEIAYLGYSGSEHHGLDYYGGTGSLIQNNNIHHLWRAFYSSGIGGVTLNKNVVHDNINYGIDPHSGTHDMYITYNKVYNNNHGIICSVTCYNMHITNNELYKNQRDGIFMDAGSHHSTIANNNIHDEDVAIQLPSLSYSEIYGNTITNVDYGIELDTEIDSSFANDGRCGSIGCVTISNNVHDNHVKAAKIGLWAKNGASSNTFSSNTVDRTSGDRGIVVDGPKTSNNVFSENHIANAKYPIRVTDANTNSRFVDNHLDTLASSGEYTLGGSSGLKLESTQFSSDVVRALDSSSIPVSISKSGKISVTDGSTTKSYDTNTNSYTKTLTNGGKIIVTTVGTASAASSVVSPSSDNSSTISISPNNQQTRLNISSSSDKITNTDASRGNTSHVWNNNTDTDVGNITSLQVNKTMSNLKHKMGTAYSESPAKIAQQNALNNLKKQSNVSPTKVPNLKENLKLSPNLPDSNNKSNVSVPVSRHDKNNALANSIKQTLKRIQDDNKKINKSPSSESDDAGITAGFHKTGLILRVSEQEEKHRLTGTLYDKTTSRPVKGMKIYFTVTGEPKYLANAFTNNRGIFEKTLNLPESPSSYKIQAHFAKVFPFDSSDSNAIIINVKKGSDQATLVDRENSTRISTLTFHKS